MAPLILDHLWQSTLVAFLAAPLVAAFRKAPAAVRHALWLSASVKFLIPFAALIALGRSLAPAIRLPGLAGPDLAFVAKVAQPFSPPAPAPAQFTRFPFPHSPGLQAPLAQVPGHEAPAHAVAAAVVHAAPRVDLSLILLAVWLLGSVAIILDWRRRWARLRKVVRSARPVAWPAPMPVLAAPSLLEPGLVGFLRPVLVVPDTLPERLAPSEIDAILAHEITHLRRRDNLTAALHMLVEVLFWFHPLVWWIGGRLIEERERACDEAVVRAGHDRTAYARSLVESCRLYLQSPLECVAGAAGSDLKARVQAIMHARPASPLSPFGKALLLAAGACAFATPVAAGLLSSPAGRAAVARATAMASGLASPVADREPASAAPTPATRPAPAEAVLPKPIALARNVAVLPPDLAVAKADETAPALQQTAAAPPVTLAQTPSAPDGAPPPPVQASLAAAPVTAADTRAWAQQFVQSYAAATRFRTISRWEAPVCIRVVGLATQQEQAVRSRVEEVARGLGLAVQAAGCSRSNIEIGFTDDPQAMLDGVKGSKDNLLGDRTSGTRDIKTVTLPIQAWYVTNGVLYADNSAAGLKVLVFSPQPGSSGSDGYSFPPNFNPSPGEPPSPDSTYRGGGTLRSPSARQFLNVFVIVDLRKTGGKPLGVIADDVAMLALSQPQPAGHCKALPSVTDLFANCPALPPPTALTPADAAYLTALYTAGPAAIGESQESHVIQRMADILAAPRLAAR